jgi:hypothetical protein
MWPQEALLLLQALRTRDPDELAGGFRRWDLRFRQLGGGSFRGELKSLQLGGTQIVRAAGTRRLQARGAPPPGSFGFAPVLPRNAAARWRGRRCKTDQVVTLDPGQEGDHLSAAAYLMVGLTVDGDLFRECAAVLGGSTPMSGWSAGSPSRPVRPVAASGGHGRHKYTHADRTGARRDGRLPSAACRAGRHRMALA